MPGPKHRNCLQTCRFELDEHGDRSVLAQQAKEFLRQVELVQRHDASVCARRAKWLNDSSVGDRAATSTESPR
jgi:hypothetical protein